MTNLKFIRYNIFTVYTYRKQHHNVHHLWTPRLSVIIVDGQVSRDVCYRNKGTEVKTET